jgi:hypothetical protein
MGWINKFSTTTAGAFSYTILVTGTYWLAGTGAGQGGDAASSDNRRPGYDISGGGSCYGPVTNPLTLNAGDIIAGTIGAGGLAGPIGAGVAGGDTTITRNGTPIVLANGGNSPTPAVGTLLGQGGAYQSGGNTAHNSGASGGGGGGSGGDGQDGNPGDDSGNPVAGGQGGPANTTYDIASLSAGGNGDEGTDQNGSVLNGSAPGGGGQGGDVYGDPPSNGYAGGVWIFQEQPASGVTTAALMSGRSV